MTSGRSVFSSDGVHYTDVEYAAVTVEVVSSLLPTQCSHSQECPATAPTPPPPTATPQMVPANALHGGLSTLVCLLLFVAATSLVARAEAAAKAEPPPGT